MPLFECSNCHCIENTACCGYWVREKNTPPLCSECDPEYGKWHNMFEKKSAVGMLVGSDGFLYSSEEKLEWRKQHQGFSIIGKVEAKEG